MSGRNKVVFLDRDGTLIHDRPGYYLSRPEDLRVYPYTAEALKLLRRGGYRLVVLTNQSGIGRGFLNEATLKRIHARLAALLRRKGARVDAVYYCPHHPDHDCICRKPKTTLAKRAIRDLGLHLAGAAVIGDKKADIDLARNLNIRSIFLRTGHGRSQTRKYGSRIRPSHISKNLLTAARWLLKQNAAGKAALMLALHAAALSFGIPRCGASGFAAEVPISSMTVKDPHDLIHGVPKPTAALNAAPWFNESLEYAIEWGILSVGKADMQAKQLEMFNGNPSIRIIAVANSNNFCDNFYKVRDVNEAWIEINDFSSLGYTKKLREGGFFRDEWVLYDYTENTFLARTTSRDGNYSVKIGTIPGQVVDILSSLYYIRSKPLHLGDSIIMDVNTKENWPLQVKVLRQETVTVPAGTFKCVVVQPLLRKEGIFIQKGKNLLVWMTDDSNHIPVQLSVEVFFGHITASLLRRSR